MNYRLTSLAVASVLLVGCASSKPANSDPAQRSDPFEGFNRTMFNFNYNVLDPYVLRPVAVAWRDYVPVPARTGLSNFLGNLEEPASMVNAILIGNGRDAGIHFTRFFLNSVLVQGRFNDVDGKAKTQQSRQEPHRIGSSRGNWAAALTLPVKRIRNWRVKSRTVSVPRWVTMASATGLTLSCLLTAASRCVRMAATTLIRFIRSLAG